jgi:hypothetical protein
MMGRFVYFGGLTAKHSISFAATAQRQIDFDLLPLTDPPKIKCGGWISGKGV